MANYVQKLKDMGLEEVKYMDFYREIFPVGELDRKGIKTKGKYTGVLRIREEVTSYDEDGKAEVSSRWHRYSITDDLDVIKRVRSGNQFCIISPISYAGKTAEVPFTRYMYALVIEIDYLWEPCKACPSGGLENLIHQMTHGILPKPTYIVCSGNGVHLYFAFNEPVRLYPEVCEQLSNLKAELTRKFWNRYVTSSYEEKNIQQEPIYQSFRAVGSATKKGERNKTRRGIDRVRAFRFDSKMPLYYLNNFVSEKYQVKGRLPSKMTLQEAKEQYPKWYEWKIVNGGKCFKIGNKIKFPKKPWVCSDKVYEWWLERITYEAVVGHRYYCLYCLAIYAVKCNVPYDRLRSDCYSLLKRYDDLSKDNENRFTKDDVEAALQAYKNEENRNRRIITIERRSGLQIPRNKRNGRKQELHLKLARSNQAILDETNGTCWRNLDGRPKKEDEVQVWRLEHPNGSKAECARDTGLNRKTVYKWWGD